MKPHFNAREGLKQVYYAEFLIGISVLASLGGIVGTLFSVCALVSFILRNLGIKKAVTDIPEFRKVTKFILLALAVNMALLFVSFVQGNYSFAATLSEINTVVNVLYTGSFIGVVIYVLEFNGRVELASSAKKVWNVYWICYALSVVCSLSTMYTSVLGTTLVIVIRIFGFLLAFFASYRMIMYLKRVYPVV